MIRLKILHVVLRLYLLAMITAQAEPASEPEPVWEPDRGWSKSGCYYAEDGSWSIAWRVHDAQFWGVPQRRKRIALVADFGGLSAPEILFERKGVSGNSEPGGEERQGTPTRTEDGADSAEPVLLESNQNHATIQTDGISTALPASMGMGGGYVPMVVGFKQGNGSKAGSIGAQEKCAPTLSAAPSGTNQVPAVYDAHGNGNGKTVPTLTGDHQSRITDYTALCIGNGQMCNMSMKDVANSLDCMHDQQAVITFDKEMYNCGERMTGEPQARLDNVAPTVRADSRPSGVCTSTVRRLTPLECERLQGFPDGWTDIGEWTDSKGKRHKDADSPRYKALGNSIALPFWAFLARRICAQYERPVTMASLFDGIGGFPLVFERCGAKAVWASEIEEFCIAVTKFRFPEGRHRA